MAESIAPETLLGDRYRLVRKLALGGMAEVWLATDEFLNRQVAVKLLKTQLATDATASERFKREAEMVAGLAHPNIVQIHDTVVHEGRRAVIMPYITGMSLRDKLDKEKRLSVEETLNIAVAVAGALDAAHAAKLVHRDVKPGNILITPDGHVLLTDFGIAKAIDSDASQDLTSENVMMGTAKYLSPEQVRGHELDGRADLYSLGLVLYECLAGKVPFKGPNDAETALARVQRDPTPLGRLRPQLHPELLRLVRRLLARDPNERPKSGAEVVAEVEKIRAADSLAPQPWPAKGTVVPPNALPKGARAGSKTAQGAGRSGGQRPETNQKPRSGNVPSRRRTPQQIMTARFIAIGIVVALIALGGLIWAVTHRSSSAKRGGTDASGSSLANAPTLTTPDGQPVPLTDSAVSAITSFDPMGDGVENESKIRLARDGETATAWLTSCYTNQYFGAKQGVGVVVKLTGPAQGVLGLHFPSAPWNVDVYAATEVPGDLDGWGSPIAQQASQKVKTADIVLNQPGRYLLVMLREVARDKGCNSANPFRGGFSEITFGPTVDA